MFNLGDRVKHLDTGNIGIVIGYGKCIVSNKCLETIKVRLVDATSKKEQTVKDAKDKWLPYLKDYQILAPNSIKIGLIAKPIKRKDTSLLSLHK